MPTTSEQSSSDSAAAERSRSGSFATTHWSVVIAAGQRQTAESETALSSLCTIYWYPLYAYVRRQGYQVAESQDLTQGFFAKVLEKHIDHGRLSHQLEECGEKTWFLWPSIPLGIVMLLGGRSMKGLRSRSLALAGAVAALIPCSPTFFVSLPFGIWALVVLMGPSVNAAFARGLSNPQTMPDLPAKPIARLDPAIARRQVRGPAIGLLVVALVDFLPALIPFGCGLFEVFEHFPRVDWDDRRAFEFFLFSLGALVVHLPTIVLLMWASRKMRQLRFRGLALLASVVAVLPCHVGFVIGIPIGIWSLAVLTRRDATAAFSAQKRNEPNPAALALH